MALIHLFSDEPDFNFWIKMNLDFFIWKPQYHKIINNLSWYYVAKKPHVMCWNSPNVK